MTASEFVFFSLCTLKNKKGQKILCPEWSWNVNTNARKSRITLKCIIFVKAFDTSPTWAPHLHHQTTRSAYLASWLYVSFQNGCRWSHRYPSCGPSPTISVCTGAATCSTFARFILNRCCFWRRLFKELIPVTTLVLWAKRGTLLQKADSDLKFSTFWVYSQHFISILSRHFDLYHPYLHIRDLVLFYTFFLHSWNSHVMFCARIILLFHISKAKVLRVTSSPVAYWLLP